MGLLQRHRQLSTLLALALGLLSASRALGQSCATAPPTPVALTLSGGVSLGAYQAGNLAYTTLVLKQNPELFKTRLLTGASAGALNALLSVLSVCGEETALPSESEFYRAWVSFKGAELLAPRGESRALLSRDAISQIASRLETKWNRGLPSTCDVVVGLSVTRLHPLKEASTLGFARQAEKLTLRIRGRGPGKTPLLTNYVNPSLSPKPLLLDLKRGDDKQNFQALKEVLYASAAFPVAFAPQELRTCLANDSERWRHADFPFTCAEEDVTSAEFLDGGIFDNRPLALAERAARMGLSTGACGNKNWREIPSSIAESAVGADSEVLYLYSDLDAASAAVDPAASDKSALSVASLLFGDVFNSSRDQDSSTLLEQSPRFEKQIARMRNTVPRMGDSLWGFFGFFERDFRAFDFYLGAWEAREFFDSTLKSTLRRGGQTLGAEVRLPQFDPASIDARRIDCLDASFKARADAQAVCGRVSDEGFVTLVRLAQARVKEKRFDLPFMLDYLAQHFYEYRDLGLRGDQASRAPAVIKTVSIAAISNLADAQTGTQSLVLSVTGPVILNLIEPLPNERDFAFTIGPQTGFTISNLFSQQGRVQTRWTLGFGLENLKSWFGPDNGRVVVTPFAGLEWQPERYSSGLLQTRFSLGAGYKFGEGPEESLCQSGRKTPVLCRGGVARAGFSFTFIERLRLGADLEVMPFQREGVTPWQLLPNLGLQFYF